MVLRSTRTASLTSPRLRGEVGALCAPGERLSGLSSCIGVLGTRITCFGVEADQKLACERDANDHFFLSGGDQPGAEVGKAFVVAGGSGGDKEQDRTDAGAAAAGGSLTLSLATVIGDRGEAGKLGNGFVGDHANLGQ